MSNATVHNPSCLPSLLPTILLPELQPALHLWPLTNAYLANRLFTTSDELEDMQAERCVAL